MNPKLLYLAILILFTNLSRIAPNEPSTYSVTKKFQSGQTLDGYHENWANANASLPKPRSSNHLFYILPSLACITTAIVFTVLSRKMKKIARWSKNSLLDSQSNTQILIDRISVIEQQLNSTLEILKSKPLSPEIENRATNAQNKAFNDPKKLDELLKSHLMTKENWSVFLEEFKKEHHDFYVTVLHNFPEVTASNLRVIAIQKLGYNNHEVAELLGITKYAVKKSKQRLRKKLGERYAELFQLVNS